MTICASGIAEIRDQINESGMALAAVVGKKIPAADEVWPAVNVFNRMIGGYGVTVTWATMVTKEDREVGDGVPLVFHY
jgi:hypothetical protein